MNNQVSLIAAKDISNYLKKSDITIVDGNNDIWVVTPRHLFSKESRKLNNQLGIHKINKDNNIENLMNETRTRR